MGTNSCCNIRLSWNFYPPGNGHIQGSHQTGSSENQLQSWLEKQICKKFWGGYFPALFRAQFNPFWIPNFCWLDAWKNRSKIDACKSVKKFNPPLGPSTFRRFLVSKTSPCTPKNPQVTNKIPPPPKKALPPALVMCFFPIDLFVSKVLFCYFDSRRTRLETRLHLRISWWRRLHHHMST